MDNKASVRSVDKAANASLNVTNTNGKWSNGSTESISGDCSSNQEDISKYTVHLYKKKMNW